MKSYLTQPTVLLYVIVMITHLIVQSTEHPRTVTPGAHMYTFSLTVGNATIKRNITFSSTRISEEHILHCDMDEDNFKTLEDLYNTAAIKAQKNGSAAFNENRKKIPILPSFALTWYEALYRSRNYIEDASRTQYRLYLYQKTWNDHYTPGSDNSQGTFSLDTIAIKPTLQQTDDNSICIQKFTYYYYPIATARVVAFSALALALTAIGYRTYLKLSHGITQG